MWNWEAWGPSGHTCVSYAEVTRSTGPGFSKHGPRSTSHGCRMGCRIPVPTCESESATDRTSRCMQGTSGEGSDAPLHLLPPLLSVTLCVIAWTATLALPPVWGSSDAVTLQSLPWDQAKAAPLPTSILPWPPPPTVSPHRAPVPPTFSCVFRHLFSLLGGFTTVGPTDLSKRSAPLCGHPCLPPTPGQGACPVSRSCSTGTFFVAAIITMCHRTSLCDDLIGSAMDLITMGIGILSRSFLTPPPGPLLVPDLSQGPHQFKHREWKLLLEPSEVETESRQSPEDMHRHREDWECLKLDCSDGYKCAETHYCRAGLKMPTSHTGVS